MAKEVFKCAHSDVLSIDLGNLFHPSVDKEIEFLPQKSLETVKIKMGKDEILLNRRHLPIFCATSWYPAKNGGKTKYLFSNIKINGKKRIICFHQLIAGISPSLEVDHINGNGLDNRIQNLRLVTHQVNQSNQRKRTGTLSKYFGVSWCKRDKKWQSSATFNGKRKNLGRFSSEKEAACAYDNYLIKNNIPKARNNVRN